MWFCKFPIYSPATKKKQIQDQSNSMSHMPMSLFHCSLHLGEQEKKWIHGNEGQGWHRLATLFDDSFDAFKVTNLKFEAR